MSPLRASLSHSRRPRRQRLIVVGSLAALALACAGEPQAIPAPRHVVLAVYDTLRADRLSLYGNPRPTTPFLDSRSSEFVVFEDVKAPASWTLPSHVSLFTGLYPAEHGAHWGNKQMDPELTTLAEVLDSHGFCTQALSANPIVNQRFGFNQGFQDYRKFGRDPATRTDRLLAYLERALDRALARDCRLFVFLNLMDSHSPFQVGGHGPAFGLDGPVPMADTNTKWRVNAGEEPWSDRQREQTRAAYDAAVRRLDDATRHLFGLLESRGVLDETLLLLTSDHGEGLGEHGTYGHVLSIWEEQVAVPLIVRWLGHPQTGHRVSGPRSLVQIPATILGWLGLEAPETMSRRAPLDQALPAVADYRSYFDPAFPTSAPMAERYPELAAGTESSHVTYCPPYKLFVLPSGQARLYDLEADAGETTDLAADEPRKLRECVAVYRKLQAAGVLRPFDAPLAAGAADTEADLQALRDLGYLQ